MSQIPLLSKEEALSRAKECGVPDAFVDLNVFRVLLHQPRVAKAVNDLLLSMLFGGALDDRLRELVIMRIGWATGSVYEWTQHWKIALERFGCTEAELLALRDWRRATLFGDAERAILSAVDETLETGRISRETWALCEKHVEDAPARLELVTAIGTWRLISQLARSLEIPLEAGVSAWPPDGNASPAQL